MTAAKAIELIESEQEQWINKDANDLLADINDALGNAADAANAGKQHECAYQTIRATAHILLLASAVSIAADKSSAPGVH